MAEEDVSRLIVLLRDPDDRVRFRAVNALLKIAIRQEPDAPLAIPSLVESLTDPAYPVVDRAMWALGVLGEPAIQSLSDATRNGPVASRRMAIIALGCYSDHAQQRAALLISALRDEDLELRKAAEQGICALAQNIGVAAEHKIHAPDAEHLAVAHVLRDVLKEVICSEELDNPPFTQRALDWITQVADGNA